MKIINACLFQRLLEIPSMNKPIAIVWFRQDLRLSDNPALHEAVKSGAAIIPVYVLDDETPGYFKMGAASRVWLYHSLKSLDGDLAGNLVFLKGDAEKIIPAFAKETNAACVYWNRCYEPWNIKRDKIIKDTLSDWNIEARSFNGFLLWEPWEVTKPDGLPYKVFTPFYTKGCLNAPPPRKPIPKPRGYNFASITKKLFLDDLNLIPSNPRWDRKMIGYWDIGESGAIKALSKFLGLPVNDYKTARDYPAKDATSHLSPHLHFGEISPNQIWYAANDKAEGTGKETFLKELGWREFSYALLFHFPTLPTHNFQSRFDAFPWDKNPVALQAWQTGQTGYPIVDAAMRELWETGYMHNRTRMIVASFLVKHLLLDWREGAAWFWDTLFDADLANNSASWQWVAGSGADAAPYFRIFNPVLQGEKFDTDGKYLRRWVPELKKMPDKYIHHPWDAPKDILSDAGVILGTTYPNPIVNHANARQRALDAFGKTK
jgi:deoxyribodipyrimidine photo-lyase